jgi:hypothetical protein
VGGRALDAQRLAAAFPARLGPRPQPRRLHDRALSAARHSARSCSAPSPTWSGSSSRS